MVGFLALVMLAVMLIVDLFTIPRQLRERENELKMRLFQRLVGESAVAARSSRSESLADDGGVPTQTQPYTDTIVPAGQLFLSTLCWIGGALFLCMAVVAMGAGDFGPAFFMLLLGVLLVPPLYEGVRRGVGRPVSRFQRVTMGIVLLIGLVWSMIAAHT